MRYLLGAVIGFLAAFATAQTTLTQTKVVAFKDLRNIAADRIVCAVNPASFKANADAKKTLFDYKVPAGKTLKGKLVIEAVLK